MLVVGGREQEAGTVAVRLRNGEDLGSMEIDAFTERAQKLAAERSREL